MTKPKFSRRAMIRLGLGSTAALGTGAGAAGITASQSEGPFYPARPQADLDADLTRIAGRSGRAEGRVILVEGHVRAPGGDPIEGALVDVWQANAHGRYRHEADRSEAAPDPDFQGWAMIATDAAGRYGFRTIFPGAYPVNEDWTRPPHIHFKVSRRGYLEVTTQMYFPDEPLNRVDRLLNRVPPAGRSGLIASREEAADDPEAEALYRFDVVLAEV